MQVWKLFKGCCKLASTVGKDLSSTSAMRLDFDPSTSHCCLAASKSCSQSIGIVGWPIAHAAFEWVSSCQPRRFCQRT